MKKLSILSLFLAFIITGCANQVSREEFEACIFGTSVAGAAIGGSVGNVGGAAAGTAVGAAIGAFICGPIGVAPAPAPQEETGYFWPDDQDGDGVRDGADRCPFTPEGIAVDSQGCELDSDGDGVPDYLDQCPDTPPGTVVNASGCPRLMETLQNVHFEFDSARLTAEAKSILDRLVPVIESGTANISVEGHTDSTGPDDYNHDLSRRRAQSVVDYLVSNGVSAGRITATGKGESHPVATNDTREGRRQNRRVEIIAR